MEPIPETRHVLEQLISQGDTEVPAALLHMTRRAQAIVPELTAISLAVLDDGLALTLVASDAQGAGLDVVQYLDGGPCVDAIVAPEVVETRDGGILGENRWRLFAKATAALGVQSSLTLPITRGGHVMGSINLYAATPDAFEGRHDALAQALGADAEHVVTNADLDFSTRLEAARAPTRLEDRDDIDIAIGLIAGSKGVDSLLAQQLLEQAAARAGVSVGEAARTVRQTLEVS